MPAPSAPPGTGADDGIADYVRLFSFGGTNGAVPYASLIEGSDGKLYGTTVQGGRTNRTTIEGFGTVFSVNKDGTGFRVLHLFNGCDGAHPFGSLVEGRFGSLYGTTRDGGKFGQGTIFRLNKNGHGFCVLKTFSGGMLDGAKPYGGLLRTQVNAPLPHLPKHVRPATLQLLREATGWALIGSTSAGGFNDDGTVFRLSENGRDYSVSSVGEPCKPLPHGPISGLIEASSGMIYGTSLARSGPMGVRAAEAILSWAGIFRFQKDSSVIETLDVSALSPPPSTTAPHPTPIPPIPPLPGVPPLPELGRVDLGQRDPGIPPRYLPARCWEAPEPLTFITNGWGLLNGSWVSLGSLTHANNGRLYGSAISDANGGGGFIFSFSETSWADFIVLHTFSGLDGAGVYGVGGVTEGNDGLLYGVTYSDHVDPPDSGYHFSGAIFRMNKDGSNFAVIKQFSGTGHEGADAASKLFLGSNGILYGTTSMGGDAGCGTIFAILPHR